LGGRNYPVTPKDNSQQHTLFFITGGRPVAMLHALFSTCFLLTILAILMTPLCEGA